jgi:hypothetical protein
VDRYRAARTDLVKSGMIRFDPKTMTVMVEKWWRNPPTNSRHHR